jgi:hypothetical protein
MSVDQTRKESAVFEVYCSINSISSHEGGQMTFVIADKRIVALKSAIVVDQFWQPNGSISITQDFSNLGVGKTGMPALT